jgi:hypothetical protein
LLECHRCHPGFVPRAAGSAVWQEIPWVYEYAFVGRANDEPIARLEVPVPHDVARNCDAERATLAPEAYRESSDESPALGASGYRRG